MHFLNVVRLDKALSDMIRNDISAKEAAENNGFSNVKSMISYCKKVYGCTPSEYKRRITEEKSKKRICHLTTNSFSLLQVLHIYIGVPSFIILKPYF